MPTQVERRRSTRRDVVVAAVAAFTSAGRTAATLDEIAGEAGVAKSTVLYHFGSRLGLLRAVAIELVRRAEQRIAARTEGTTARQWVRALLEEQRTPAGRVLHEIGDELAQHGALAEGDPQAYLVARLDELGVEGDTEVVAAATLQFGRSLAYGAAGAADVDRMVAALGTGGRLA